MRVDLNCYVCVNHPRGRHAALTAGRRRSVGMVAGAHTSCACSVDLVVHADRAGPFVASGPIGTFLRPVT